ncbi:MAG: GNAT family N-acetyltransferase [Bacteroidales bacterium]|jgi:ribosomal-protein-alanine N-acetyltransferase|nr:GNAT family N-acetyltransferase [Bacteroidales bacterium]
MKSIVLRDYKKTDFNSLNKLWDELGLGGTKRGDNDIIITQSIGMGGKFFVLENIETKEIIGSSWMTFDGRRIHLHHIGVKPEYQNKGYGKLLTKESINFAKEKGYQIKLEVHNSNSKAIKLYENLQFDRLGNYDVYIIRNVKNI